MAGAIALGGAFIPFDTQVDVSTTETASYQTALNLASGTGAALVSLTNGDAYYTYFQITVDSNVVCSDWIAKGQQGAIILYFSWASSFKVEYKTGNASGTAHCEIAYKNYT